MQMFHSGITLPDSVVGDCEVDVVLQSWHKINAVTFLIRIVRQSAVQLRISLFQKQFFCVELFHRA
ncbi:hypothetical protein SDC9_118072 [bioreactor metagenome]|uniref:Uncharacterized protein n=1 Tax=bioreactor metagenome TaxID=1076179 RepID=A0A645C0F7_9ZZZZ